MGIEWKDIMEKDKIEKKQKMIDNLFKGNRDKQRKMLHNCLLVLKDSAFSSHVSIFFFTNIKISSFSIIKVLQFILGTIPLGVSRGYFFSELTLVIGAIPF